MTYNPTIQGPCVRCGATNHELSMQPGLCPQCARQAEKEILEKQAQAWRHWQHPHGTAPREDQPAPAELHPGLIKSIGR